MNTSQQGSNTHTSRYTNANWGNHSLSPAVVLTHEGSLPERALTQEIPGRHTVTDRITHQQSQPFGHTPNFFSLLGHSPQPWSHEATGWGCRGCVLGMSY